MKTKAPTEQEVKIKGGFSIITSLVIVILIFSFFLVSCGAKKTDKTSKSEVSKMELTDKSQSEQSEESETNIDTNVKKSEIITVNDKDQTTTVEETIEPIDASKLASFTQNGKKQELFNSKKTTKTTVKKNNSNTNINTNTEASQKAASETNKKAATNNDIKIKAAAKKKEEDLHVDRKSWSIWNLWWLLVPVLIYLVYKNYKIGIFNFFKK